MENKKIFIRKLFLSGFFVLIFFVSHTVSASQTNGTIDTTSKYAWGENIGWINFGCDRCNVQITDTAITGNAWSSQFGWINLAPSTSGVHNDSGGTLSGDAWSSNLGWIDFTGVTINTSGEFLGYATLRSDNSQINFNCADGSSCATADFKVKTDWRPASVRTSSGSSGEGGAGGSNGGYLPPPPPPILPPPATPPSVPPTVPPVSPSPVVKAGNKIADIFNSASDFFVNLFGHKKPTPSVAIKIPKIAPLPLSAMWNLLPVEAIHSFVFAPLPYEIRILASKFPELDKTLKSVGVNRLSDLNKLNGVALNLPGLADTLGKTIQTVGLEKIPDINNINGVGLNIPGLSDINTKIINGGVGTGKIALIAGLPIAKFPLVAKKNLPAEFVFARASGELVDLNVAMSVGEKGDVAQQISSLPGQVLKLVVKPISRAKSVTGYFVFRAPTPRVATNLISRASLTASALFSTNDLVTAAPVPVEQKLVLSSFEYTDPDHDGIYTADVATPSVPGEYEVVTVIDYVDPVLGTRKMSMITVVDPEGYVFEKNNGKETRIPSAIVSLYVLNNSTKKYELWNAKDYSQENPQITDIRGTYSFLVPAGSYYFQVEAPGYNSYQGKVFVVVEGSGIHENIELSSGRGWLSGIDFQTVLLVVVCLLLVYNLFKDKLLKFLLKKKNDGE